MQHTHTRPYPSSTSLRGVPIYRDDEAEGLSPKSRHLGAISILLILSKIFPFSCASWFKFQSSAITRPSFSKSPKTPPFLSIFAKNDPLFAKNAPKSSKTSPKRPPFGTLALLRCRSKPKNADHEFPKPSKSFISPYKKSRNPATFTLSLTPKKRC